MAKRISVDKSLFVVTLLLVFLGLVMVFSASAVIAKERFGSPYTFVIRQFAWAVAGLGAMFALMRLDYRRYKQPAVVFSLMGITTLLLIAVFFLDRSHNTHRWIRFGGLSFQPSELAKPSIILFLAWFLESRARLMDDWRRTLIPAVLPAAALSGLIVLQPDLGTGVACCAIAAIILFVAGMRMRYFAYALAPMPILFYCPGHPGGLALQPHSGISRPVFRPPGSRLPRDSVPDCRGDRRPDRAGIDGREAEAVLPS